MSYWLEKADNHSAGSFNRETLLYCCTVKIPIPLLAPCQRPEPLPRPFPMVTTTTSYSARPFAVKRFTEQFLYLVKIDPTLDSNNDK